MSRVQKNYSQKSEKQSDVEPVLLTRPKKNLKKMEDIGKDEESDYEIAQASKKKSKKSKKKKEVSKKSSERTKKEKGSDRHEKKSKHKKEHSKQVSQGQEPFY